MNTIFSTTPSKHLTYSNGLSDPTAEKQNYV